jgi:hypothetical protein
MRIEQCIDTDGTEYRKYLGFIFSVSLCKKHAVWITMRPSARFETMRCNDDMVEVSPRDWFM